MSVGWWLFLFANRSGINVILQVVGISNDTQWQDYLNTWGISGIQNLFKT